MSYVVRGDHLEHDAKTGQSYFMVKPFDTPEKALAYGEKQVAEKGWGATKVQVLTQGASGDNVVRIMERPPYGTVEYTVVSERIMTSRKDVSLYGAEAKARSEAEIMVRGDFENMQLTTVRAINAYWAMQEAKAELEDYVASRPEMGAILKLRDDEERYKEYWAVRNSIDTPEMRSLEAWRVATGKEWLDAYFAQDSTKKKENQS